MRKLALILLSLFLTVNAYAVDIIVTLTQEQYDAMGVMTVTPEEWAQSAVTNKADKMIDRLVKKYSDRQPGKITKVEKKIIFSTIDLLKEKKERRGIK